MEFETLIAQRYSVRRFQPEHLPQEVLGWPAEDAKPLDLHFKTRPMEDVVVYESF